MGKRCVEKSMQRLFFGGRFSDRFINGLPDFFLLYQAPWPLHSFQYVPI